MAAAYLFLTKKNTTLILRFWDKISHSANILAWWKNLSSWQFLVQNVNSSTLNHFQSRIFFSDRVMNVKSIRMDAAGVRFWNSHDHSKWAISFGEPNKNYVCIGDINRAVGDSVILQNFPQILKKKSHFFVFQVYTVQKGRWNRLLQQSRYLAQL